MADVCLNMFTKFARKSDASGSATPGLSDRIASIASEVLDAFNDPAWVASFPEGSNQSQRARVAGIGVDAFDGEVQIVQVLGLHVRFGRLEAAGWSAFAVRSTSSPSLPPILRSLRTTSN